MSTERTENKLFRVAYKLQLAIFGIVILLIGAQTVLNLNKARRRNEAETELLPTQRELAKREKSLAEKRVSFWRNVVTNYRRRESEQQAVEARRQVQNAQPALRQLAERNAQLAEQRKLLVESISKNAQRLKAVNQQVELSPPRIPVVSNVDAQPHTDPGEMRDLLLQQIVSPVRWEQSVRTMMDAGVDAFYEVGAGKVLRGLMKRIHRKTPVTNV